jgi:hypothetical protein
MERLMANALYNTAANKLMTGVFDWRDVDLMLVAWGGVPDYLPSELTIGNLKARTGLVEIGVSMPVTEQSVAADGTGQTNTVVIPEVPVGPDVTWFTLCERKTPQDSSALILFVDTAEGLPYEPNGLDLVVHPDWMSQRGWFRP